MVSGMYDVQLIIKTDVYGCLNSGDNASTEEATMTLCINS
jgi:hypothetical protein